MAALDHVGHALELAGVGACLLHQRARLLNARASCSYPYSLRLVVLDFIHLVSKKG